jgi:GT2 family glycosyltransferase
MTTVATVILTMGNRPDALDAACRSVRGQHSVDVDIVIVWNGTHRDDSLPGGGVRHVETPHNVGIPEGRNIGLQSADSDVVFFLDDDAEVLSAGALASALEQFERSPRLAAIGFRLVDEEGATAARHVPRIGAAGSSRSGMVTAFLGGAVAIRTKAFNAVGGYCGPYFYAMEETDLALRLIDAGWNIRFDANLHVFHPKSTPSRHVDALQRTARNRVWLAHRLLPAPIALAYLLNWLVIGTIRDPRSFKSTVRAYRDGWRKRIGPRLPILWRTVWHLTKLGRPPVL